MKLFMQYSHMNKSSFVLLSLLMSFEAISLFNQHNHLSINASDQITDEESNTEVVSLTQFFCVEASLPISRDSTANGDIQ
jgi:hypothetical protein